MSKVIIFAADSKSLYMFRGGLVGHLKSKGLEVVCYCSEDSFFKEAQKLFHDKGVELKPLDFFNNGKNLLKDMATLKKIYSLLKEEKPNYIFSYHTKPGLYVGLCCWFFPKIKFYPTITGLGYLFSSMDATAKFFKNIICLLYRFVFKRSTKVFFQNKDDLNLFEKKKVIASSKALIVNGSGINLNEYPFHPLPEKLAFLFIGRIIKDKGIIEYLDACKILKEKYPSIDCRLIGATSKNPTAISNEIIQEKCDMAKIEYVGEVYDVRPWLEKTSVFVLPSYREGLPRSGLEALSMGRAVITTDVPGCREIVQDGINGYLVPEKNSHALAKAMIRMAEQKENIHQMGQASRKMAEQRFDVNLVNKAMLEAMGVD